MSYFALLSLFLLLSLSSVYCHGKSHVISIHSLLPSTATECSSISTETSDNKKLQIFHKQSPCAPLSTRSKPAGRIPSHEFLLLDESRATWLQSRVSASRNRTNPSTTAAVTIPDHLVLGEYVVQLGFGTPTQLFSVILDTGSDISWIQCQPCRAKDCFPQADPLFDPSRSSSYSNVSCTDPICSHFGSECKSSACLYSIEYGDGSTSQGLAATETLTLTSSQVLTHFQFGCGQIDRGSFQGSDGLVGLARSKISLASQAAEKYGNIFSYCLPSSTNTTGFITFGAPTTNPYTKFTPMIEDPSLSFYFLELTGLSVAGKSLNIPHSVFSNSATIIDSGTTITRLPMPAYTALRDEFRKQMAKFPRAPALGPFDTCFDLTGQIRIEVPGVEITFAGGASLDVDSSGILFVDSESQVCLAFIGIGPDEDVSIIGNMQQVTYDVAYDVGKGLIGFGPGGCN